MMMLMLMVLVLMLKLMVCLVSCFLFFQVSPPDDVVDDDVDGVGLDVEVDGLLGLLLPVLPSISTPTVFSTGQQMLATLLVKPHEYSERNFNFSLGDKLSRCCSADLH